MKQVRFVGRALDELREFPVDARHDSGVELQRVQRGLDPKDWKPMTTVGKGVREIRVRTVQGICRTLYVATLADCVYVLHCFTKTTKQTPQSAINLAKKRLQAAQTDAEKQKGRQS